MPTITPLPLPPHPLRVLIGGGGTGGHLYPALEVLQSLSALLAAPAPLAPEICASSPRTATPPVAEYLLIGTANPLDEQIARTAGLPFVGLAVRGVRGQTPLAALRNLAGLAGAVPRAWTLLRRHRPHAVFIAGGYVCVPVAVAARLLGIPTLVMTLDSEPGWAVRVAARLATAITAVNTAALAHLPRHTRAGRAPEVVGYPVRSDFWRVDRATARATVAPLPTAADDPLVVVFGGSQGARSINSAVQLALPRLTTHARVLHIGGQRDAVDLATVRAALPAHVQARYRLVPYLEATAMAQALAAADLAICRAGAGTLAELAALGLPAIVIPGPFSAQDRNAAAAAAGGAAHVLANTSLTATSLADAVLALLTDQPRRAAMAAAAAAHAHPAAATRTAALLLAIARQSATAHRT